MSTKFIQLNVNNKKFLINIEHITFVNLEKDKMLLEFSSGGQVDFTGDCEELFKNIADFIA